MKKVLFSVSLLAAIAAIGCVSGQPPAQLRTDLQARLEALHAESGIPGVNVGVVLADGTTFGLSVGLADTALGLPMEQTSRLMQGSVGKTYVAAVAIQLIHVDEPVPEAVLEKLRAVPTIVSADFITL